MVLVTRQAPDFTAAAVLGSGEIVENFNFKQHTNGKTTVLFFWPMDFTFVCPSELIAFDKRYEEFQKRGVEVVGVSFDSEFVHNAWRNTPVDEMLRMVDALQFHEEHGDVCPAQWEKGKEGMNASPDGVAKYLTENVSSL